MVGGERERLKEVYTSGKAWRIYIGRKLSMQKRVDTTERLDGRRGWKK